MRNVILTAMREYKATAMTKAFIFGVVIFPAIVLGIITLVATLKLFQQDGPTFKGVIVLVDELPDQPVAREAQERIAQRLEAVRTRAREQMKQVPGAESSGPMAEAMIDRMYGGELSFEVLSQGYDDEEQQRRVQQGEIQALIIVRAESLPPGGSFDFFRNQTLPVELTDQIRGGVSDTIVNERLRLAGLAPGEVRAMMVPPQANTLIVTETGVVTSQEQLQKFLPAILMILLWISVFTGGQYLLMSTIEEKSSRVMEVLLSAVSPMALMTGKILGQALVGLTILGIYVGVSLIAAGQFNVLQQLQLGGLWWLAVYFLMAYFLVAAMMAAIGSAVTEMREANSLMGPIMTVLMIPMFLWFLIMENPNSILARVTSFFPPTTPFVMIIRMSQTTHEVPLWEVIAATLVGALGVVAMVWAAAKIFRIGVLMYGKPPTIPGLIKWLRYN